MRKANTVLEWLLCVLIILVLFFFTQKYNAIITEQ